MGVAGWSGSLLRWDRELTELKARLAPAFGRADVRQSAWAFVDGMLSGIARKTGWQLAEQAGLARPYPMQSVLGRSRWDADALRDLILQLRTLAASIMRLCGVGLVVASPFGPSEHEVDSG